MIERRKQKNEFQCLCQIVRLKYKKIVSRLICNLLELFCWLCLVVGPWLMKLSSSMPRCSSGKRLESLASSGSTEFWSRWILRSDPSVLLEASSKVFPFLQRFGLIDWNDLNELKSGNYRNNRVHPNEEDLGEESRSADPFGPNSIRCIWFFPSESDIWAGIPRIEPPPTIDADMGSSTSVCWIRNCLSSRRLTEAILLVMTGGRGPWNIMIGRGVKNASGGPG